MPASKLVYLWAKRTNAGANPCLTSASMMCLWNAASQEDRNNKKYGLDLQRHKITIIRECGMSTLTVNNK